MIALLFIAGIFIACHSQKATSNKPEDMKKMNNDRPHVLISTSMGEIEIELFPDDAPLGVKNFLQYVNTKFYDGTIFHRVINGFMIQGGGFTESLGRMDTFPPIAYEGGNGLSNLRGTIAYARTSDPNSATSQFFINHRDNFGLDHGKTQDGYGYAVFGKVVRGMDVVDKIAIVQTGVKPNGMRDVPVKPVIINSVRLTGE
ncbi:peptidylprolyl isomerase [bacterium]|nr:peptidylprolyl isomerase [bacterium]